MTTDKYARLGSWFLGTLLSEVFANWCVRPFGNKRRVHVFKSIGHIEGSVIYVVEVSRLCVRDLE